jgi:2-polyprenyl-3-methyl-5-hydroxy-6-metoxy-1,4-benzoquinol methylase
VNAPAATILSSTAAASKVWDRLWEYAPTDERDDVQLARERRTSRWATIHDRLVSNFGTLRGLRTIELGSGRGDLSVLLAQAGADVTLLDTSERALDQARKRFDRLGLTARFECGDLFTPPVRLLGSFDVALSSGVIEHFEHDVRTQAFRAHADVLNPRGLGIISVPNAWCPPYRLWKFYFELRGWWPYGLEIPYSRREMIRRARVVGFSRIEIEGAGFWQSVGDHLGRGLCGRGPDWAACPSCLDRIMGMSLILFGRRGI